MHQAVASSLEVGRIVATSPSGDRQPRGAGSLSPGDSLRDDYHTVQISRNRIDSLLNRKVGEIRVVARGLAADPDLSSYRVGPADEISDGSLDRCGKPRRTASGEASGATSRH